MGEIWIFIFELIAGLVNGVWIALTWLVGLIASIWDFVGLTNLLLIILIFVVMKVREDTEVIVRHTATIVGKPKEHKFE